MTPSKSSIDRLPKFIAECWEDDRKALLFLLLEKGALLAPNSTFARSRDVEAREMAFRRTPLGIRRRGRPRRGRAYTSWQ
jgi:hypothetical protein